MNAVGKVLDQAAPTAGEKSPNVSEPPTRGQGQLFEKWIEFLKQLKDGETPDLVLMKTLNFYRRHVDQNVLIDFRVLEQKVFAYRLNDEFGWIRFYTVDGLEIYFMWLFGELMVCFDHLARTEVIE